MRPPQRHKVLIFDIKVVLLDIYDYDKNAKSNRRREQRSVSGQKQGPEAMVVNPTRVEE